MEFTNEFVVRSDIETTFATLTDLEKVVSCLPGAVLEDVDGDTYTGSVKVRVGPALVTYQGTARLAEVDTAARRGRIEASGQEARGSGTASATITAQLTEVPEGTRVEVVTDLRLTGKVAQFGRGVLGEVGSTITNVFADRLRAMLTEPEVDAGSARGQSAATAAGAIPGHAQDDEARDRFEVAGAATPKRLVPRVLGVLAVFAALRWWRRGRRD